MPNRARAIVERVLDEYSDLYDGGNVRIEYVETLRPKAKPVRHFYVGHTRRFILEAKPHYTIRGLQWESFQSMLGNVVATGL